MVESTGKLAVGLVLLVVLWIGVYWLYEPKPAPISADDIARPVSVEGAFSPVERASLPAPSEPPTPPTRRVEIASAPPVHVSPAPTLRPEPVVLGNSGATAAAPPRAENAAPAVMSLPPAVAEPSPEGAPIKVIPPEMIKYAVQKGDTFESISERYYGVREFASAVAKANPFTSPDRLREGRVINIPKDPNNIYGVAAPDGMKFDATIAPAPGTPTAPAIAKNTPRVDPPKPPAKSDDLPREYVVQSGDTLSGISKKLYGTTKNASRIFEANRKILDSADDLREGQTLVIPPREKVAGPAV